MKKRLFYAFAALALVFASCSNDIDAPNGGDSKGENTGLKFAVNFAENSDLDGLRASQSTAIPTTGWANIKQVQMFLYANDGTVAFSDVINPSATVDTFRWTSIAAGTYNLVVVANVKSSTDPITTTVGGIPAAWTGSNVQFGKLNDLAASLGIDFPVGSFTTHYNSIKGPGDVAVAPPSEVFMASRTSVVIASGVLTDLSGTPLQLKREVSMMRVRAFMGAVPAAAGAQLNASADCVIQIHQQPTGGMGVPLGAFAGGVSTTSSKDRILVAAKGPTAFLTTDPTAGYLPVGAGTILNNGFTHYRDIIIFPNAAKSEGITRSGVAAVNRRFFIQVSAAVPAGYVDQMGSVAAAATTAYWSGTIEGVFLPNIVREVNLSLLTKGLIDPNVPVDPTVEGGLKIEIGTPLNWDSVIERSDKTL